MENPRPLPLPLPPLPDEILIVILSKLPVKSLLRFRCVSKSWRSLISLSYKDLPPAMSGLFYKNYITKTIRSISLHQSRTYIPTSSIDASLDFLPRDLDIADYCNGLLLLTTFYFDTLYVCNPATRKWAQIQQPPTPSKQLVLAFDPNKSKHYRIISIPFPFEPFEGEVDDRDFEIFSSETREWTKAQRFVGFIYLGNQRFAFSNGMLYYADASVEDTFAIYIDEKVCRRIRRPAPTPVPSQTIVQHCLGQSGGFLHYALILYDEMLVWVLEDPRSEEYVLKHRNSVQAIVDKMGGGCLLPDKIAFHPDLDVIFLRMGGKLFSYHMISTEVEEICSIDGGATLVAYSPCYLEDLDLF